MSTAGATVLAWVRYSVNYFLWSMKYGPKAQQPCTPPAWSADTSPPPTYILRRLPLTEEAYAYHNYKETHVG